MRALPLAVSALLLLAAPAGARLAPRDQEPVQPEAPKSVAVGGPWHGRLVAGVQRPPAPALPPTGPGRVGGPARLWVRPETVALEYRQAHPEAPPLLIADLSRQNGGHFGREFGGLGHASHQNGLDADVMYPRKDRLLR